MAVFISAVMKATRSLEALSRRSDPEVMEELRRERIPARTRTCLYCLP